MRQDWNIIFKNVFFCILILFLCKDEDGRAADILLEWDAFTLFVGMDIIEKVFAQF